MSVSKVSQDFSTKAMQSGAVSVPDAARLLDEGLSRATALHLGGFYKESLEISLPTWFMGLVTLADFVEREQEIAGLGGDMLAVASVVILAATQGGRARLAWRMAWAAMDLIGVGLPETEHRPRALALGFRSDSKAILPILLALPQALMAFCGPRSVGDVPVYLLRATLFAAERHLQPYDMFLADVLEALGAARLFTATGPQTIHQLRESAARLQSALRIREREEYNFRQRAGPVDPDQEEHPLPPPLAIPLASNCVLLAEYEIALARFTRTRRFRRSINLHKAYASVRERAGTVGLPL